MDYQKITENSKILEEKNKNDLKYKLQVSIDIKTDEIFCDFNDIEEYYLFYYDDNIICLGCLYEYTPIDKVKEWIKTSLHNAK